MQLSSSRGAVRRRGRFPSGVFLLGCVFASGCLVSFDGYRALGDGASGEGGAVNAAGSGASAGKSTAGEPSAGGGVGATGPAGGKGGRAANGGSSPLAGRDAGGTSAGVSAGGAAGSSAGGVGTAGKGGGGGASGGAAGSAAAGAAGSGGQAPKTCPVNLEGPPMIEVPKPGGGFFCMDRSEVPNKDYAAFLAANPNPASQPAVCAWNSSFQPDVSNVCVAPLGAYDPVLRPRSPVSCIDWCDANKYCEWAGKHLCGAIAGGPNPVSKFADAKASQWYAACSKGGAQQFPYGDSYQPSSCVGLDSSTDVHPSPVANTVACEGGYPGLFDLSGNVAEWEDSCAGTTGATDACLVRGGDLFQAERTVPSLLCNSSKPNAVAPNPATQARSKKHERVGFRCCFDY